jgi:diacylglycerol kinase family enzyme
MDVAASEAAPSPARHAAAAPAPRRFAVVLNSAAGALVGRADPEKTVAAAFAAQGLAAEFIPRDAGDLPTRVGLARDSGAEAVVAIGGDGTVACAAQVLVGSGVRLGLLPSGTMNLLAKDLGLPIGDLDAAVRVLAAGVARPVDVGEVDGHVFLCAAMMGLPTRLARHREAGRGGAVLRLWSRFARAAIRALSHSRPMRLDLLVDGQARRVRTASLTVSASSGGRGSMAAGSASTCSAGCGFRTWRGSPCRRCSATGTAILPSMCWTRRR